MNSQRDYWMQLFANLVNASPKDTRNMVTHISLFETENEYVIEIAAPFATNPKSKQTSYNGMSDYAYLVNAQKPHKGWIENQIRLTERIVNGSPMNRGNDL